MAPSPKLYLSKAARGKTNVTTRDAPCKHAVLSVPLGFLFRLASLTLLEAHVSIGPCPS